MFVIRFFISNQNNRIKTHKNHVSIFFLLSDITNKFIIKKKKSIIRNINKGTFSVAHFKERERTKQLRMK